MNETQNSIPFNWNMDTDFNRCTKLYPTGETPLTILSLSLTPKKILYKTLHARSLWGF